MEDQLTSEIDLMLKEVDGLLSGGPQLSVLSSRDLEAAVASADRFVSKYSAEFMASAGQVKADGRWRQVAQSFDSLSMTTMWNVDELPSPLPDGWKWIAKGGSVQGAGNKSTRCEGRLEILEYKFTNLGTPVTIRPAVLKLPRHVVCVVGSKDMLSSDGGFDIMMDLANFRVYVISLHEIVRLDWLPRVICRLNSEPVNMIAWYGGLNPEVSVAKDLGWRVNMVFNIESDRMAREISSGNHDEVRHSDVVDARNVTIDHLPDGVNWFGVTGGPPCQLSSRRNSSPQKDTALFECMMHVMHKLLEEQDFNQLYENVVPNTDLVGIREEWDEIIALPSQRHEALDSAAMARRDRLYWSDSVDFESLQKFRHRCPEVCLSPGWHFEQRPPPPLLASGDRTEHKVWLIQENTNFRRTADSDERDRIHPALKAGISGDGIAEVRNIGNGNAFSADVFWHVMREWRIDSELHVPVSLMTADDVYAATPDQMRKIRPDLVDKDPETVDRSVTIETEEVTGLSPQPLVTGLSPQTEEAIMTCMPVSVHTFHQPLKTATQEMPRAVGFPLTLPHGTAAYTLLMSDEQWGMVSSAYAQDHTETCGVRMAEIFQLMHNNPEDVNVMRSLSNRCDEWLKFHLQKMDQRAKYNQLHLLSKQAGKRGADYGFQVGDKAAVNDQVVTIVKVPPAFAECRATSMNVEFADGKRKDVMTSKLRPLAVDRFENTNRTSLPNTGMEVGDLIFYQSGSDQDGEGLLAGVITMIADEQIEVQIHQPKLGVSTKLVTWLPRWEDPMHLHKILRFRACPKGCHPFTDRLVEDQIVSTGEFSGPGYRLTDDTIYHLRSMGYDVELQADSEDKDVDAAACLAFEDESFREMFPNS